MRPADGLTLTRPDGSAALGYTGLAAYDATGKTLPASLEVQTVGGRQELLIHVNDAGAQGAITIDPFVQEAKFTASDGAAGNVSAVGCDQRQHGGGRAPYATVGNNSQGAAYVFTESGRLGRMTQTAKLTASDGTDGDDFGSSVSISGNTVVVEAPEPRSVPTATRGRPTCSLSPAPVGRHDPDRQAHRVRWHGGRRFRRLGFD